MQIKEDIKAPRYWPLCGEFTGTGEFPAQRASYAENVSIWWRHHGIKHNTFIDPLCVNTVLSFNNAQLKGVHKRIHLTPALWMRLRATW